MFSVRRAGGTPGPTSSIHTLRSRRKNSGRWRPALEIRVGFGIFILADLNKSFRIHNAALKVQVFLIKLKIKLRQDYFNSDRNTSFMDTTLKFFFNLIPDFGYCRY